MIEIRKSVDIDIDNGLLETFIEGYRHHQEGRPEIFLDLSDEQLKEDLLNNLEKFETIVALEDSKVVGYLSYEFKERHVKKMHIDQLVVLKDYRGKGLGRMLLDEARKIAIENNCDRIELDCWTFNQDALDMYEHVGYQRQRIMYEMKL